MKILQLAPRMPFPLTDGGAIGIYNITKYLAAQGHEMTLVTFPLPSAEENRRAVADISQFAKLELTSKPLPPRWQVLLKSLFRGPYPIERRMTPEMFSLLEALLAREKFDVVHVDHPHMGRYGLWIKERYGLPVVLREHNFEAQIYERFAAVETNLLKRWLASMHGARLRKEEVNFLRSYDAIAAISPEDEAMMRVEAPDGEFRVIPAGVDSSYFTPSPVSAEGSKILWVGGLDWDPNFDALKYFLLEIFPLILSSRPDAILQIIGNAADRVSTLVSSLSGRVQVLGRVADIRDFLPQSAVLVVPLRIGGGMRLKLLEFFAAGKAVVSTTIGAEGNAGLDGEHLLIRDSAASFAEGVLDVLNSPELGAKLGLNARALATSRYSWTKIAGQFADLYSDVIEARPQS